MCTLSANCRSHVCWVSAVSYEVLQRFKVKLQSMGIRDMLPKTEGRLLVEMYPQLLVASHEDTPPDAAVQLYDAALARIGTETRLVAECQHHLSINGPWHAGHPYILSAVDTARGCLQIVKILPTHEAHFQTAADRERSAITALGLDGDDPPASCVPCRLLSIDVPTADAQAVGTGSGSRHAYCMPWYPASLLGLPQLSQALILQAGQDVRAALTSVHSCGLVHADVKAANIMVSGSCCFYLADWGACVKVGQPVEACTEVCPFLLGKWCGWPSPSHNDLLRVHDWPVCCMHAADVPVRAELGPCRAQQGL